MRSLPFVLVLTGCVSSFGGAFSYEPTEMERMSPAARELVKAAHEGIDPARLFDFHTHVVGLGTGNTGTWVNPKMQSWLAPIRRFRFAVYADSAGVTDLEQADAQYVERLLALARSRPMPGKHLILAFDHHYDEDGTKNLEHTDFYVPNEYVVALAEKHPDLFVPAMSVHPYRPDAIAELEKWAGRGVRLMKWLPNAMGMDPADPRLDPFYKRMHELGVTLLTHAGGEKAVEAEQFQKLGNPLRLRRALDNGVRVIVAHCASLEDNEDLDNPGTRVDNFELFMRLMKEPRYNGLVFGEISAMTQANRLGVPLTTALEEPLLRGRLVNGSDYPLPAINVVIRLSPIVDGGWITEEQAEALAEIYDYNPLLFDFVLKRTLRAPGSGARFPEDVFYSKPEIL
jgi:uncharacterized protein